MQSILLTAKTLSPQCVKLSIFACELCCSGRYMKQFSFKDVEKLAIRLYVHIHHEVLPCPSTLSLGSNLLNDTISRSVGTFANIGVYIYTLSLLKHKYYRSRQSLWARHTMIVYHVNCTVSINIVANTFLISPCDSRAWLRGNNTCNHCQESNNDTVHFALAN